MVAGVKLLAIPNKLYDSNRGDFLVIGYHQKGNKILAWWNHSKKEGSNISLLHLLFNSYIIAGLICVGIPLWFVWKTEHFSQQQMNYIQIGSIAGIVLCYIFGYFEWKKKRLAQTLVNEQKSKLN